jgi:hypothetical protein
LAAAKLFLALAMHEVMPKFMRDGELDAAWYDDALVVECVFRPSWTAFQADRGRDFSVIVDDLGRAQVIF